MNQNEFKLINDRFDDLQNYLDGRMSSHEKRIEEQIMNCQGLCALKLKNVEDEVDDLKPKVESWIKFKYYIIAIVTLIAFLTPILVQKFL